MAQRFVRSRSLVASVALALFSFACGGGDGTETLVPATVEAAVATTQSDTVGKPAAITPAVKVKASNGKAVSGVAVTFAATSGTGATLGATTATTGADGVATAGSWTLGTTTGSYQVTATVATLAPPTNAVVFSATAVADAAAKLMFLTQPGSSGVNTPIAEIQVQLLDQYGNYVTTTGVPVTLAIGTNPGSATIGGTVTVNTGVGGAASFSNVTLSALGTGYTLVATSPGLVSVTSTAFSISAARIVGQLTLSSNVTLLDAPGGIAGTSAGRAIGAASALPRIRMDLSGRLSTSKQTRRGRRSSGLASTRPSYSSGELIVTFRESSLGGQVNASAATRSLSAAQSAGRAMRARLEAVDGDFTTKGVSPALRAARIVADPAHIDAVAARLRQDPAVERVERNALAHVERDQIDRSSVVRAAAAAAMLAPTQTTSSNDSFRNLTAWNYGMIDLPQAWTITRGSPSVLVAVVDNGIRFDHPDLAPNLTSDGYDFVSSDTERLCNSQTQVDLAGDGDGYDADPTTPAVYLDSTDASDNLVCVTVDEDGGLHGLHVAGTIGAVGNNGSGIAGINWNVKIRPIRALNGLGSGTFYDIAQAVLYAAGLPADNGHGGTVVAAGGRAPIINMSLGGSANLPVLQDAINRAVGAGSLVIVAAGNENSSQPSYPAAYDNVISVSAVGPDRQRATYSNFGSTVDIAAPGGDFCDEGTPTAANPCAGVRNGTFAVWSTDWDFAASTPSNQRALFGPNHGTSMAAPHVSGVAALLLANEPGLTASQLRSRLLDFAVDAGAPGRDDVYGFGILNARNSLTQSLSPARQLFAALYNATTGARLRTQRVDNTGQYAFNDLTPGTYRVYAGQDEGNDLQADPGRRWSAFAPGSHTGKPATITIAGGEQSASFEVGFPSEQEANNTTATADVLPVGGYLQSTQDATDVDWYRINITTAGDYTLETGGVDGTCGFTMEEDTDITLFQSDGATQIARNDDINAALGSLQWCSRITTALTPGTYYLRVQASSSTAKAISSGNSNWPQIRVGRYRVQLRSGT